MYLATKQLTAGPSVADLLRAVESGDTRILFFAYNDGSAIELHQYCVRILSSSWFLIIGQTDQDQLIELVWSPRYKQGHCITQLE